jgi:hypothetical protein
LLTSLREIAVAYSFAFRNLLTDYTKRVRNPSFLINFHEATAMDTESEHICTKSGLRTL